MAKKTAQSLKEQAKKLLAEAREMERIEAEKGIREAGELVKAHLDKNFEGFTLETFKEQVKSIFGNNGKPEKIPIKSEPLPASETEAKSEDKKKKWF